MLDKNGNEHKGGHYKRDEDLNYLEEQAKRKLAKLRDHTKDDINSLRWIKAIAQAAVIISKKDIKKLNVNDYLQIAKDSFNNETKFKALRIKSMFEQNSVVKERLNNQLVQIYAAAGLDLNSASTLLRESNEYASEKRDGNLKLKLAQEVLKANNLTNANTAHTQNNTQINFAEYRENEPKTQIDEPQDTQEEKPDKE